MASTENPGIDQEILMKTARIPVAVVAALLLSLGIVLSQPEEGQDSPTFSGSYDWVDGGSDELSAEFEPDG